MQAPPLPIRPGMDVYSAYQDQYIGTVSHVWLREDRSGSAAQRGASSEQTGTSPDATENPPLRHEQERTVSPTQHIGRKLLGEEMGPVPTIAAGNTGPVKQSAEHAYATDPTGRLAGVAYFAVRPARPGGENLLNLLARPLYVPVAAIHSISMDRVVLGVQREQIPSAWRIRPDI